jgi:hypothetical protein
LISKIVFFVSDINNLMRYFCWIHFEFWAASEVKKQLNQ